MNDFIAILRHCRILQEGKMADAAVESSSSSESVASGDLEGARAATDNMEAVSCGCETPKESPSPMASGSDTHGNIGGAGSSIDLTMEKILQKQRSEIMFELRRLQLGDRPVTGQGNKEAVEEFFTRQDPATQTDTEQHRPESVVVEVQGLVESRPVSSMLQSARFRRNLENALRGSLDTLSQRAPSPTPPRPSVPTQDGVPTEAAAARARMIQAIQGVRSTTPRGQVLPSRARGVHPTTQQLLPPGGLNRTSVPLPPPVPPVDVPTGGVEVPLASSSSEFPSLPDVPIGQPNGPALAEAWLQNQTQNVNPSEQVQMNVWETLEQSQREGFISDISELIQRQLVTQTLDSQFRGVLESRMRDRVQNAGSNGQRVADFVRSLPAQPHQRNDFSDLGILPGQPTTAASISDDTVSFISATAAVTVPYAQSNTAMCREMQSLKAQVREMKSMLRLSMDLQMDTQRVMRQELAYALSQINVQSQPPMQSQAAARPVDDSQCLICLDNHADSVMYQCGHMCVCYTCGLQLKQNGSHCPMCRAPIKDIIRAFRCNQE